MKEEPIEPIVFSFNFKINGRVADCGVKKTEKNGEQFYTVYTNVDGDRKEFPMIFNKTKEEYSFEKNAPPELKTIEHNLSEIICDMSKEC